MFEEISEVFFENFREKWNWKDERTKSWWIFREADENWRGEEGWIDKIETNISENVKKIRGRGSRDRIKGCRGLDRFAIKEKRDLEWWIFARKFPRQFCERLRSIASHFAPVFISLASEKQPSPILILMRLEKPRKTRWARNCSLVSCMVWTFVPSDISRGYLILWVPATQSEILRVTHLLY